MLILPGYHLLSEFWFQGGYQHVQHPPVTGYHWLPACSVLAGYRLPAVTKKSHLVTSRLRWLPGNRVTAPADPIGDFRDVRTFPQFHR